MSASHSRLKDVKDDLFSYLLHSLNAIDLPQSPDRPKPLLSQLTGHSLDQARGVLTTMHFLYPHEFLLALDLLDRGLISCLKVKKAKIDAQTEDVAEKAEADTNVFTSNSDTPPQPGTPKQQEVSVASPGSPTPHTPTRSASIQTSIPVPQGTDTFYIRSSSSQTDPRNRIHSSFASSQGRFRNAWNPTKTYYEVRLDTWNCSCAAFAQKTMQALIHPPQVQKQVHQSGFGDDQNEVEMLLKSGPDKEDHGPGLSHRHAQEQSSISRRGSGTESEGKGENESNRIQLKWRFGGFATLPVSSSSLPLPTLPPPSPSPSDSNDKKNEKETTQQGKEKIKPVCKHILAAALSTAAPRLFGHGVTVLEVSSEEMAAWAVGWGDG